MTRGQSLFPLYSFLTDGEDVMCGDDIWSHVIRRRDNTNTVDGRRESCVLGNGAELATEPIWRLLTPNFLLGWQEMPFWFKALLVRFSVSFTKIFKYSIIMPWGKNYLLPIDSHSPIIFFARKQEVPMGLKMLQTCFPIFTPQSWVYNAILVCHSLG